MRLDEKYNIPKETIIKMVNDGVISGSMARNYEILEYYQLLKKSNPSMKINQIISNVAEDMRVSTATVEKAVYTLRKNS